MRFDFTRVPLDPANVARPLLSLDLEGLALPVTFLIDTGAVANRLSADWAASAGIDLTGRRTEFFGVGGVPNVRCILVEDVQVTFGDHTLSLAMWFCDPWAAPFGLLGQEGFLQYFMLALNSAEGWFELEPIS